MNDVEDSRTLVKHIIDKLIELGYKDQTEKIEGNANGEVQGIFITIERTKGCDVISMGRFVPRHVCASCGAVQSEASKEAMYVV
jgi:hypothetical protein